MSNLGDIFKADRVLMEKGVWKTIPGSDSRLFIAAYGNDAMEDFLRPHQREARSVNGEVPEHIIDEAIARFVILDWDNIDDEGVSLEPTFKNKLAMLEKYPQFKGYVVNTSINYNTFSREQAEQEGKNSNSTPAGSPNTGTASINSN